ncbi:TetR/AcrR family transcriptional regulator [Amorphus sp. 3PC139-8]
MGRRGRPSKGAAEATSKRILDVAAAKFAAQGFAGTSVEKVASECGVGKDTLYRRFPSKLALFDAVVEHLRSQTLERLDSEIAEAAAIGDAMTRLKRLARWFLTINLDPEMVAFKRIALSEAIVFGAQRSDPEQGDPIFDRLVAHVGEAQKTGALRAEDPAFLAGHLLNCIVFGPSNDAMLGRSTYAARAAQDAYFDRAWVLFVEGAARREEGPRGGEDQ